MAVGSIALYRDTNNTQTSPAVLGTWEGVTFNNQEREDSPFTQNANDIDVNITETGKYLCIYTIRTTSTSNLRHTLRGRILLGGSIVESGYGAGYSRNDDLDETYVIGHAILDVTSGDDVRIEWTNVGIAATDVMSRSKTSLMLVRLTDVLDVAYGRYTDGSDSQAFDGTNWKIVLWNTIEEQSRCSVIERGGFGNEIITLKKIARYLVKYTITFDDTGRRSQRIARATLDGVPIKQSFSYTYLRNPASSQACCVAMFIVETTETHQQLRIECQRGVAALDANIERAINSSGLDIMELHSGADTIITHDSTGGQNMGPITATAMNWARDEDQINSSSFSTPSSASIQVENAGDYLFMANGKSTRLDTTSINLRVKQAANWFINGTEHNLGGHGGFIRGSITGSGGEEVGTFEGSFNAAVIFDNLALTSSIEFRSILEDGTGSFDDNTNPDECGFTALNLDLLIPIKIQPEDQPDQPNVVVVLSCGSTWTVPANFDNVHNTIELIGAGAAGRPPTAGVNRGGTGGGAGAYQRISGYDTAGSSSIAFKLGVGGIQGFRDGGNTIWGSETASLAEGGDTGGNSVGGAGGTGSFNGGSGGSAEVGAGPLFRGRGGGGAGGPSGSGGDGGGPGGSGGAPSGGLGGIQGTNIDNPPTDGGTGSVWLDTKTGEIAGSGGGGGGGAPQHPGAVGGLYGGGGGGGGKTNDLPENIHPGGDGQDGVIVITYRSTLHALGGRTIDDDNMKMTAFNQRIRASIIDSDNTTGQLLRFVTLGPTSDGGAVMIDDDALRGKPRLLYKLSVKVIDGDIIGGKPTFDFRLSADVHDNDALASRLHHIVRFRGRLLDDDKTKAFLNVITRFPSAVVDGDGGDSDGIVTGFVNLSAGLIDEDKLSHIVIDPSRDIAFFVSRDPRPFSGSAVIEGDITHHSTLHGFRLVIYEIEGMPVEATQVEFRPIDNKRIQITLTEVQMDILGL